MIGKQIKRWGLVVLLLGLLGLFFYFHLYRYLSFDNLKMHRAILLDWTNQHFFQAILGFMLIYTVAVAISIPGAAFLTVLSGFLFGPLIGSVIVVIAATLGACIVFIAVELAFHDWMEKKAAKWLRSMKQGFQNNAFSYLLFLRLIPIFPFWLINIVPALLGISKRIFITATFIGIIPGSFVYTLVGNGLGHVFDANKTPTLSIIFEPEILIPILALAILSLVPIAYKRFKRQKI
ncbi:MAG: TVP38/TMEM64 family protein [Gammaproteobacteria bacterium]|nr:TVP38/TMEM64 family protein [Gammaproteobacteria bacterium]